MCEHLPRARRSSVERQLSREWGLPGKLFARPEHQTLGCRSGQVQALVAWTRGLIEQRELHAVFESAAVCVRRQDHFGLGLSNVPLRAVLTGPQEQHQRRPVFSTGRSPSVLRCRGGGVCVGLADGAGVEALADLQTGPELHTNREVRVHVRCGRE